MRTEKENDPLAELRLYALCQTEKVYIILVDGTICAGFPSAADDYFQSRIDLNEELIRNPDATFGIWVQGDSMQDDGIGLFEQLRPVWRYVGKGNEYASTVCPVY